MTQPKLTELDLSKAVRHTHPDIVADADHHYLAQINGRLHFGTFSEQHYGLNFNCNWGASGMQFDAPGSNYSRWQRLWLIEVPGVDTAS
jgi:hypothetical protein